MIELYNQEKLNSMNNKDDNLMSQSAQCYLYGILSLVDSYLLSGNPIILDILQLHIESYMDAINDSISEC